MLPTNHFFIDTPSDGDGGIGVETDAEGFAGSPRDGLNIKDIHCRFWKEGNDIP